MPKFFTLLTLVFSTFLFTMMPVEDAEAKRFGFGKSFGKQYSMPKKAAPTRSATNPGSTAGRSAAAGGARTSGASRWLGPLAGLAAGGLLASLFFGDAFDGIQPMDILLILAVVMGGMMLMRAMARKHASPSMAGNNAFRNGHEVDHSGDARFGDEGADYAGGMDSSEILSQAPPWFDEAGFANGAKTHFIRLQAAWDKSDLKDIAEYTTPELYAEIQNERLSRGGEGHFTEVVTLNAQLEGVQREDDQVVASVRFSGLIRESEGSQAEEFDELWHVVHPWESAAGDWKIAGIQQA